MYDSPPFQPPTISTLETEKEKKRAKYIMNQVQKATEAGVQTWQVNLKMEATGVSLSQYFKLDLFKDKDGNTVTLTEEDIEELEEEEKKQEKKIKESSKKRKENKEKKEKVNTKTKKKKSKKQKN